MKEFIFQNLPIIPRIIFFLIAFLPFCGQYKTIVSIVILIVALVYRYLRKISLTRNNDNTFSHLNKKYLYYDVTILAVGIINHLLVPTDGTFLIVFIFPYLIFKRIYIYRKSKDKK